MVKLGLVQAPACKDWNQNLNLVIRYAREAREGHCEALCFPECFLTGYFPTQAELLAVDRSSPGIQAVGAAAKTWGVDLLVGFMERSQDGLYITHGLFRRDGKIDFYRKTHLGRKEAKVFRAGDCLPVFSLSCGLRVGVQLCVETHFSEITQTLSLKGAEVIFAPHASPSASGDRKTLWGKYIPARSYDNRVYLACCNLWDGAQFGGGCVVTTPTGEMAVSCFEDKAAMVMFPVDREEIREYHSEKTAARYRYFPAARRPELYE